MSSSRSFSISQFDDFVVRPDDEFPAATGWDDEFSALIRGASPLLSHGSQKVIMAWRSGIYIVPTDRWYVERTVWLIAGFVLIAGTSAALLVNPLFALFITATGVASIVASLTGFCVVANVLHAIGLPHALGTEDSTPGRWYFMKTDRWYLERRIYVIVGINISIASVLSIVHSAWWLTFTGFVGVAMLWFAATGFCIMANGLYWFGYEPRLAPDPPSIDDRRKSVANPAI